MRNKKGSHVGMVLSFTMFIVFLIFAYTIIGAPINSKKQNEDMFKIIENEVIKEISELVYTSRIYDTNVGCIEISNPNNDFDNLVVIVKNKSGEIASEIVGGSTFIVGGSGFMKAYYSDDFFENSGTFSGSGCVVVNIESISEEKRALEGKIILLMEEMNENYSVVKNKFGISSSVDFNLQFDYENGTILNDTEFKEMKREIFATKIPINYLDGYANEKVGGLIIKIW